MTFKHRKASERGGALQVVLIILGVLVLLILLAAVIAFWALKNYVKVEVERSGDVKQVEIQTPFGDLEIRKAENVAEQLRLPVYPGATPGEDSGAVRLRARMGEAEGGFSILAADFHSEASFDDVDAWYREKLGAEYNREVGTIESDGNVTVDAQGSHREWGVRVKPGGNDVLYSRQSGGRLRGVALKHEAGRVKIGLFEFSELRRQ